MDKLHGIYEEHYGHRAPVTMPSWLLMYVFTEPSHKLILQS